MAKRDMNRLPAPVRFQLALAISNFVSAKTEPFENWTQAEDHFAKLVGTGVTKWNLQTVIKLSGFDYQRVVKSSFPDFLPPAAMATKLGALETKVSLLETRLIQLEQAMHNVLFADKGKAS